MTAPVVALIVFFCVCGSAALGLLLQGVLPVHHLSTETRDVVRLTTGLIATIAALVLSLLISSAKSSFDRIDDELVENASKVLMLDRVLNEYGDETKEVRALLKSDYAKRIEMLFSEKPAEEMRADGRHAEAREEHFNTKLLTLVPDGVAQTALLARAQAIDADIEMTSALIHVQREESLPLPLLVVLILWLSVIFSSFALFAPRNGTAVVALFVCALSASCALMLILEMNSPFTGLMKISAVPMRDTLAHLGE